jgi:hypothetical protein
MSAPNPRFLPDSPVEATEGQVLFASPAVRHRGASSLVRLDAGRLLLAFRLGTGPSRRNDGAIMLTHSDDEGRSWDEPFPIYAYPGWDSLPLGGLVRFSDDLLWLVLGRVIVDESLGGDEPFSQWHIVAIASRDGGRSWSEPGPAISLFPYWTEMYGASNPHPLPDGRYLLAVMGTIGRDAGWQAGVTSLDLQGGGQFTPPVIIAAAPDRNFSDLDLVRLADGRFLAVIREHVTRQSVYAHSADEGRTWSAIRPTGFKGANIKLFQLRSGAVLCAYRDENPRRRGISCSVSADGGVTWRFVGQLYAPDGGVAHQPGLLCGYPDLISLGEREIACVLHTYPDADGRVQLHFLRLRDRS